LSWISIFVLFCFAILNLRNAYAQDPDSEAAQARQAAAAEAAQQAANQKAMDDEFRRGQKALGEFLTDRSPVRSTPSGAVRTLRGPVQEFQLAIPKFRDATSQYRELLGLDGKLDKPLKMIRTQIDVMLRSLKST